MRKETNWYEYDDGFSIGTSGADGGIIARDEEHAGGARITLEEESSFAPFSITCGVYGWMFHTRYFTDEAEAAEQFELMKADLDEILQSVSADDEDDEDALAAVSEELSEFVEKYP
ncbi:MAG TPA: hypothetical protein VNI84_15995 [Pyrinomonadaceae bacterium]|nr:hypothetical protein [Pyrinomonadaceae bacterium]